MKFLSLYFSGRGRMDRRTFWRTQLLLLLVALLLALPEYLYPALDSDTLDWSSTIVLTWAAMATQAKRWHDVDRSAWWLLLNLIPIVGWIWAGIVTGFFPSTPGANRYGPGPT